MAKKIVIVGGGLAGLSAGIYARMNGYEVQILERHTVPGGLCTGWSRGGYHVDGCIHWLIGTKDGTPSNRLLREIGALDGTPIVHHDVFTRIDTGPAGNAAPFIVYGNADRLREHMLEIAPEDACAIEDLVARIKRLADFPFPEKPVELMGIRDMFSFFATMKPFYADYKELGKITLAEYATRFKSPRLREGIAGLFGDMPDFSALGAAMMLAWQHAGDGGYPVGGSLALAKRVERRYLNLGGSIRYGASVSEISVKGGKAVGVVLANGEKVPADIVVSAADGHATLFDMLKGRYVTRALRRMYETFPIFEPLLILSLGVARDLSAEPHQAVRALKKPNSVEGKTNAKLGVKQYCYDPSLAPAGKSVIEIMYSSDYDYWKRLSADRAAYDREKALIAKTLIGALEEFYPGISADIEMTDVATPLTFERYTGNWRGSYEGWRLTPRATTTRVRKTLPGLKNFYMIGQWVQPGGGIPNAVSSGRDLAWILCSRDGKAFKVAAS